MILIDPTAVLLKRLENHWKPIGDYSNPVVLERKKDHRRSECIIVIRPLSIDLYKHDRTREIVKDEIFEFFRTVKEIIEKYRFSHEVKYVILPGGEGITLPDIFRDCLSPLGITHIYVMNHSVDVVEGLVQC